LVDAQRSERRLRAALERISTEHREIVVMRHFEDLSYAEIGALLGIPEGTVMSRLFRARRALAAAMKEDE
jgi:RNA polymerase sigma-70 factor (ECF subfamily)